MKKFEIKTSSKLYPVYYESGLFQKLNLLIAKHDLKQNTFIIIDQNVYKYHNEKIDSFISRLNVKVCLYSINPSEINKSHTQLNDIYSALIENGFGRDTLIVAIGGGITGDIAGFAASTFSRGVNIIHVPTTLLAMVDSSIGGKTGINFESTKNIIGTFYQPDFVLIDTDFLKTLPEEEFICGLGEVIKYSLLIGNGFLKEIKKSLSKSLKLDKKLLLDSIDTCIKFKSGIVEKDEKELNGLRKVLNLGHTFAHAIEVERGHTIKHGQSVIIGLTCSLYLSKKLGILNEKLFKEYLSLFLLAKEKIRLPFFYPVKIYEIMKRDKKAANNKLKFVLLKEAGNILIDVEASKHLVLDSINEGLNHFIVD
ncbi:MAG: 3-dehydroquinate synthase [Bacteroidota bacterium]